VKILDEKEEVMPRKKTQPKRQFVGNPVMVIHNCFAYTEGSWVSTGDEFDSRIYTPGTAYRLKKGQVGLAVGTQLDKVMVLIGGQTVPIARQRLRPVH
jgi:hypothetical protein